jgi:hypothetical protein
MPITHYGMVMGEVYRIKIYGEIAHPILLQNGLKNLASCYTMNPESIYISHVQNPLILRS